MKNMLLALSLSAAAFASAPANAGTYLVDFDNAADGTAITSPSRITNQYAAYGLSFSLFEKGAQVGIGADAENGYGRTSNGLWNNVNTVADFSTVSRADLLRITFASAASGLSFSTTGDGDRTQFNAYDLSGKLLQSITNTSGATTAITFTASGISRLDALQSIDNFTFSMDNLAFTATPGAGAVPETATWAMMILGMGAVGYAMRRRIKVSEVNFTNHVRTIAGA